MWRIYVFNLNEIYPAVINLVIQRSNKQLVTYGENQNLQNVIYYDHISKTMPTEFFTSCSKSKEAQAYLYREFPEHYIWDNKYRQWNPRKKKDVIGWTNSVNPAEGERYFKVIIKSLERTYIICRSINSARNKILNIQRICTKKWLLESDNSILECLEATTFQMPHARRRLFTTILVYC